MLRSMQVRRILWHIIICTKIQRTYPNTIRPYNSIVNSSYGSLNVRVLNIGQRLSCSICNVTLYSAYKNHIYYFKTHVWKLKMCMIITLNLLPFAVRVNGHMFVVSIYFFLYNFLLHFTVKPRRHKICFDIV